MTGTRSRKTAHVISHSHWDREWYLPFEKHRYHLIKLMDRLLETMERDPAYRSFHLDGQTILLEDYLSVRPERREKLKELIREGRLHIGPWYVLQDEFLTSGEANIRNLLAGLRDAREFGAVSMLGYFPDSFGHIGQAPQILQQAGIEVAAFGRGVKPTGFNNEVGEQAAYESPYSELLWEAPDGSRVLGILFANWYSNGNEVPTDPERAKAFWDDRLAAAEKYASTPHLLFMNGCDHQPVQTDLPEALRLAAELYPDTEFVHSDFDTYAQALKRHLPDDLSVVRGELRSQRTDGWGTLVNTASARVYLKQMNERGQTLLEKGAEPLAAYASLLGLDYPHHQLQHAWKTLMQNHPHDSICGCSVDEVHREMVTRFEKSGQTAECIIADSIAHIAQRVDTSAFADCGERAQPFVVFNTTGWTRGGIVSVDVDISRIYFREGVDFGEMKMRLKTLPVSGGEVLDSEGRRLACSVTDLGLRFGYDLPDDRFRQPYFARTLRVEFEAADVPGCGHRAFAFIPSGQEGEKEQLPEPRLSGGDARSLLSEDGRTLENDRIRATVEENGSITLIDKAGGRTFRGLCVYENTGDVGNEYMYRQPNGETTLTTELLKAEVSVLADTPYEAALEIVHEWQVPAEAEASLEREREELIWFTGRRSVRAERTVTLRLRTIVRLERGGRGLRVRSEFDNTARDHRVRMLFPTDLNTGVHYADSIFEAARRDNEPAAEWRNPSYCHHQQAFVSLHDEEAGLTIASKGLNEYEVLRDGRNTIAVTLLRSVGELGDWGLFPTPEAQCPGPHAAELMIVPHGGGGQRTDAYAESYLFQTPLYVGTTDVHGGEVPPCHSWLEWSGRDLALSACKVAEDTGDVVVRWYNWSDKQTELAVEPVFAHERLAMSDVLERRGETLDSGSAIPIAPYRIVTLAITPKV
ncbi:alpha-mannosidase [Cohnella sp. CIP 111063]|uniref:alpha-mannosidase n=1 Tax=unclassified Cohnella TaxID=2636738 RepID=UPI000B8C422F|nr:MULTISPECIES: alpha-mannosidase [unclassified Cohnella]OXS55600.1 alpha-mannosidase [Cohnella sp. CIP 111063]PRX66445.1 alpha-mannosidase [Cohnella sp. SGD-V74]